MKEKIITLLTALNLEYNNRLIQIDIEPYVNKIIEKSTIVSILDNNKLTGFISYYCNDEKKENAFLSMICTDKEEREKGYGKSLLEFSIQDLRRKKFKKYGLEVLHENTLAKELYLKYNFTIKETRGEFYSMELAL